MGLLQACPLRHQVMGLLQVLPHQVMAHHRRLHFHRLLLLPLAELLPLHHPAVYTVTEATTTMHRLQAILRPADIPDNSIINSTLLHQAHLLSHRLAGPLLLGMAVLLLKWDMLLHRNLHRPWGMLHHLVPRTALPLNSKSTVRRSWEPTINRPIRGSSTLSVLERGKLFVSV